MNNIIYLILSFFYIGKIKIAPGTIASIVLASLWYFIPNIILLQSITIIILTTAGLITCWKYSLQNKQKAPAFIVVDEVVGMSIALFMIPKNILYYFIAIALFRAFDILKPSIIFHSQYVKNGLGIMLDDIISGILSSLILVLYIGTLSW